jgi:hypothetical protein
MACRGVLTSTPLYVLQNVDSTHELHTTAHSFVAYCMERVNAGQWHLLKCKL